MGDFFSPLEEDMVSRTEQDEDQERLAEAALKKRGYNQLVFAVVRQQPTHFYFLLDSTKGEVGRTTIGVYRGGGGGEHGAPRLLGRCLLDCRWYMARKFLFVQPQI
jgi:hypothetical protein